MLAQEVATSCEGLSSRRWKRVCLQVAIMDGAIVSTEGQLDVQCFNSILNKKVKVGSKLGQCRTSCAFLALQPRNSHGNSHIHNKVIFDLNAQFRGIGQLSRLRCSSWHASGSEKGNAGSSEILCSLFSG